MRRERDGTGLRRMFSLHSASVSGLIWNRQGSIRKLLEVVRTIFPGEVEQMMDSSGKREKNVLMWV